MGNISEENIPEKTVVSIALAADNGYAYPMLVTIQSIVQNAADNTSYHFYLLIPGDFTDENKEFVDMVCSQRNDTYEFINMQNQYEDADIHLKHITKATYYRLQLPSLLPEVNKCLYMDTDIIVTGDLAELFSTDMEDTYIAGVRALGFFEDEIKLQTLQQNLGIGFMDDYVNAGVLLMNLELMRNAGLEDVFRNLLVRSFKNQDQDILNCACFGHIKRLHFKYNAMTKYPLDRDDVYSDTYLNRVIDKTEWDFARNQPVIIHYADKIKPWNDMTAIYADRWWKTVFGMCDDVRERIILRYFSEAVLTINAKIYKINEKLRKTQAEKSEINAKLQKTYAEKSEINAELQKTYAEKSEINAELQKTYAEKSEINAELQKTYAEKSEINAKLQKTYAEKAERGIEIKKLKTTVTDKGKEILALTQRIDDCKRENTAQKDKIVELERIVNNYKNSFSYRFGAAVTYIPRKLARALGRKK